MLLLSTALCCDAEIWTLLESSCVDRVVRRNIEMGDYCGFACKGNGFDLRGWELVDRVCNWWIRSNRRIRQVMNSQGRRIRFVRATHSNHDWMMRYMIIGYHSMLPTFAKLCMRARILGFDKWGKTWIRYNHRRGKIIENFWRRKYIQNTITPRT